MDAYGDAVLETLERLGRLIFQDDAADFEDPRRRFSYAGIHGVDHDHPSPVHHWQIGLLMMGGAKLARVLAELSDLGAAVADDPLARLEAQHAEVRAGVF